MTTTNTLPPDIIDANRPITREPLSASVVREDDQGTIGCPDCGHRIRRRSRCPTCPVCGWSKCSV